LDTTSAPRKITTNNPADNTTLNKLFVDILTSFLVEFNRLFKYFLFKVFLFTLFIIKLLSSLAFLLFQATIFCRRLFDYSMKSISDITQKHTSLMVGSCHAWCIFTNISSVIFGSPSVFENISSRYSQRDKKAGLPSISIGNPAKTMHDNFS
jgi:hypothetical protein